MEPLYESALALAELANLVYMYKMAIDMFMAQLTATCSWKADGKTTTDQFLIGVLWIILALCSAPYP